MIMKALLAQDMHVIIILYILVIIISINIANITITQKSCTVIDLLFFFF